VQRRPQGKHWVIGAEGEWAHGGRDRTTPASRCWEECWNDASIPDAIGASYRRALLGFVPRCIPRKRDPGRRAQAGLRFLHTPPEAYHHALSPLSHLHLPPPRPSLSRYLPIARYQTRIASAARLPAPIPATVEVEYNRWGHPAITFTEKSNPHRQSRAHTGTLIHRPAMDHQYSNNAHHMDFHRPNSTLNNLDRKPSAFSFDDNATLDSTILDTPVLMSPTTSTQGIFSPDTSIWEDFSAGQFVDRTATSSVVNTNGNNPFFTEQSNNPFARLPPNQAATYGQQSWPVTDNSGSRTPTAPKPLNPFGPGDFGAAPFVEQQQMPFHGLPVHQNVRPSAVFPSAPEQPMSPHTHSDWMAFNQQEMDARPGPKRMRPNTPPRSFSPRRDGGIRKKNARFDIPAERTLVNIDNLIQSCTNEEDLKELKQQKRLLRNRQAAYVLPFGSWFHAPRLVQSTSWSILSLFIS